MVQSWDALSKRWFRSDPQGFIDLLAIGGVFRRELPDKLQSVAYEVDGLLEVEIGRRIVLVHVEIQTYRDGGMDERLLGYNVNARLEYKLPVLSVVFHLMDDGDLPPSPLSWKVPVDDEQEEEVLAFRYRVVEVSRLTPREIWDSGHPLLGVLIPFAKGGLERREIEYMRQELLRTGNAEMALIGQAFAAKLFEKRKDQAGLSWLVGRFREMQELWEESPIYKEIVRIGMEKGISEGKKLGLKEGREEGKKEGIKEGIKEGREEGIKEGREEGIKEGIERGVTEGREEEQRRHLFSLRQVLLQIVTARFPDLGEMAREQLAMIEQPEILERLTLKLALAQSGEEAKQALFSWQS